MNRSDHQLQQEIAQHFLPDIPARMAVAVSGGSDSLAMLILLHDWLKSGGPDLCAVTVDHGLRPEAAQEAAYVGRVCAGLNIDHHVLEWRGWDRQGNLPDKARRARYDLMADWAQEEGIEHIVLGHTADDQAETFLMRLARGSGLDGLSAMDANRRHGAVQFCRPALQITRADLRGVLRERGIEWIDDPSNENEEFERVRARKAMGVLKDLGITATGLSTASHRLKGVKSTIYSYVEEAARDILTIESGDILCGFAHFESLPPEVARRLLQSALNWVSGADYAPRGKALTGLLAAIGDGKSATLHGCLVTTEKGQLRITREFEAVADMRVKISEVWDGRWKMTGPKEDGLEIAALGEEGLRECPDWRDSGLPYASLKASPAIRQDGRLIAAPLAGFGDKWQAELVWDENHVFAALLSH